jgi:hypothetical protein
VAAIRARAESGALPRLPIGKLGWRRNRRVVEPTGEWCFLIADEARLMDRNEWPIVPGVALTDDRANLLIRGKKEDLITSRRWLPDTKTEFFSVSARFEPVPLEDGAALYADVLTREHPELRALVNQGLIQPPANEGAITEPDRWGIIHEADLSTGPMPPEDEVGYFEEGTYHLTADPEELSRLMGIPVDVITSAAAMNLPPWWLLAARNNVYTAAVLRNAGIDWGARYADGRHIPS